jgi:energy-coupling factor transport system substrate-specific component
MAQDTAVATDGRTAAKKKKLKTKDLITAGAFSAIYIVVALIIVMGSSAISPLLYLIGPLTVGTVTGTIYTLAVLRTRNIVPVLVMGGVFGAVAASTTWVSASLVVLWTGLACVILVLGKFGSKLVYNLSFIVYNLTMTAPFAMLVYAQDKFVEIAGGYYGQDYADTLSALTPNWIYFALVGLALAGGVAGSLLANRLIAKHFSKAGVV